MGALLDRVRRRAWLVTPQRRAIAEALSGEHVHMTAEEVHLAARLHVPEVSLATVYHTLNELVLMKEVVEMRFDPNGSTRYDPNVTRAHQHLVCVECNGIYDVYPTGVGRLKLSEPDRRGFRIEAVEVVFRGRCQVCDQEKG